MKTSIEQVEEFHNAFSHPINDIPNVRNKELNALRVKLLLEEVLELASALDVPNEAVDFFEAWIDSQPCEDDGTLLGKLDAVEVLDALSDIQYVLDGAYLALGYHNMKDDAFAAVHESNMSKLGEDGKPVYREDGKVLKGPNYRPVDLRWVLDKYDPKGTSNDA